MARVGRTQRHKQLHQYCRRIVFAVLSQKPQRSGRRTRHVTSRHVRSQDCVISRRTQLRLIGIFVAIRHRSEIEFCCGCERRKGNQTKNLCEGCHRQQSRVARRSVWRSGEREARVTRYVRREMTSLSRSRLAVETLTIDVAFFFLVSPVVIVVTNT